MTKKLTQKIQKYCKANNITKFGLGHDDFMISNYFNQFSKFISHLDVDYKDLDFDEIENVLKEINVELY
jgi:hypothetical protein